MKREKAVAFSLFINTRLILFVMTILLNMASTRYLSKKWAYETK